MMSYSVKEVANHRTKDSLWVTHKGKVYDVTDFVERHPGGGEVLLEHAGGNVSQVMSSNSPHPHSPYAYQILEKYCIGNLTEASPKQESKSGISLRSGRLVSPDSSPSNQINNNNKHHHSNQDSDISSLLPAESTVLQGKRENDHQVDWSKPIFWQVGSLGEKYDDWVHMPVEGHIRLFHRDWVERFADTPWWIIPIVWIPIALIFFFLGVSSLYSNSDVYHLGMQARVAHTPFYFVCGVLLWTLVEYIVHRWLFHLPPPPHSPFLITMHFILHGQHHKAPFDKDRLVFPPVPGFGFGVVFWLFFNMLFPPALAQIVMSGAIVGYMCYDLTHYYLHHGTPFFSYFKRLKSYHVKHHFLDYKKGFGISSKLWDYPFGTLLPDTPIDVQKSR